MSRRGNPRPPCARMAPDTCSGNLAPKTASRGEASDDKRSVRENRHGGRKKCLERGLSGRFLYGGERESAYVTGSTGRGDGCQRQWKEIFDVVQLAKRRTTI